MDIYKYNFGVYLYFLYIISKINKGSEMKGNQAVKWYQTNCFWVSTNCYADIL